MFNIVEFWRNIPNDRKSSIITTILLFIMFSFVVFVIEYPNIFDNRNDQTPDVSRLVQEWQDVKVEASYLDGSKDTFDISVMDHSLRLDNGDLTYFPASTTPTGVSRKITLGSYIKTIQILKVENRKQ